MAFCGENGDGGDVVVWMECLFWCDLVVALLVNDLIFRN